MFIYDTTHTTLRSHFGSRFKHTRFLGVRRLLRNVQVTFYCTFMWSHANGEHDGTAMRRRQRRLRQWLQHERLSVAMALAEFSHHAAPRGQMMARAGGWVRDALHGRVPEEPTPQEPDTQFYDLDDVSVSELGGSRPDQLSAVSGPQEWVQRHTVEQMADGAPVLPMLDAPVPLVVEQPVEVLKILDNSLTDVEQVIEVPKIILHQVPQCAVPREPQPAEQLVEVPVLSVREVMIMAPFVDTAGRRWNWISTADGVYAWCLAGTQHV